jgi:hypothetical protein
MKVFGSIDVGRSSQEQFDDALLAEAAKHTEFDRASYLIQCTTEHRPSTHSGSRTKLYPADIMVFSISRGRGYGHADSSMRWCATNGCWSVFPWSIDLTDAEADLVHKSTDGSAEHDPTKWPLELQMKVTNARNAPVHCPHCGAIHAGADLTSNNFCQMPVEALADRLSMLWERLGGEAEFYLLRQKHSHIRQKKKAIHGGKGFNSVFDRRQYEELQAMSKEMEKVHYSYASILKDLASGTALSSRLTALLKG